MLGLNLYKDKIIKGIMKAKIESLFELRVMSRKRKQQRNGQERLPAHSDPNEC